MAPGPSESAISIIYTPTPTLVIKATSSHPHRTLDRHPKAMRNLILIIALQ